MTIRKRREKISKDISRACRINPKPREWWIVDNGGPLEIYVHRPWGNPPVKEIIHVIEVP